MRLGKKEGVSWMKWMNKTNPAAGKTHCFSFAKQAGRLSLRLEMLA